MKSKSFLLLLIVESSGFQLELLPWPGQETTAALHLNSFTVSQLDCSEESRVIAMWTWNFLCMKQRGEC